MLADAEKFTKNIFNIPSLQFRRAVTHRVPTGAQWGDVLIAEWEFQEAFGNGSIVLTDTPYYSTYNLRVRDCHIRSQAELTAFLRTALVWNKPPLNFRSDAPQVAPGQKVGGVTPGAVLTIHLPASALPIASFSGGPRTPRSASSYSADFLFDGLLEANEWYFQFRVGKSFTHGFYPVPPWIPERFPPLVELAKSWGYARIRGEVGQTVKPFEGGPDFTADRDRILIAELARRGLSDDQVLALLTDVQPTPRGYELRLDAVIGGMKDAGGASFVSRFFVPALKTYEQIGPVAEKSADTLFRSAAVPSCLSGLDSAALETLKQGMFVKGPLAYLARCSTSREALRALEDMPSPDAGNERLRAWAISSIQRRIDGPAKGNRMAQ